MRKSELQDIRQVEYKYVGMQERLSDNAADSHCHHIIIIIIIIIINRQLGTVWRQS